MDEQLLAETSVDNADDTSYAGGPMSAELSRSRAATNAVLSRQLSPRRILAVLCALWLLALLVGLAADGFVYAQAGVLHTGASLGQSSRLW